MRSDARAASEARSSRDRRRGATATVLRSLLVSAMFLVGYFVLPLTSPFALDTFMELTLGLGVVAGLLTWQLFAIIRSPFPAAQAIAALLITVPLLLTLFGTVYYLMSHADPGNFSEPLTRLDALYFTVTTFATVGFGDITASSQVARAAVTLQMVVGIILVGLIARVVLGAVQFARSRRRGSGPPL